MLPALPRLLAQMGNVQPSALSTAEWKESSSLADQPVISLKAWTILDIKGNVLTRLDTYCFFI